MMNGKDVKKYIPKVLMQYSELPPSALDYLLNFIRVVKAVLNQ